MARFTQTVESSAALAGDTTFANIVSAAAAGFKLRRVILGVRAGATTPTSQQLTVAVFRATARGTVTTTVTGLAIDPNSAASAISGIDTVWSVNPTLAASPLVRVSFNSQSGADLPFEGIEELIVAVGTANGLAFRNVANALPASHLLTLTAEWEE